MPPSTTKPPIPILIPPPLQPPNPSILLAPPSHLSSLALGPLPSTVPLPPYNVPNLFLQALSVRIPVFVHEQGCSLEGEVDEDDARSWQFVAFAEGRACATLRVVPPDWVHHGERDDRVSGEEKEDVKKEEEATEPHHGATGMWDGREKYIKIGRMATLKEYRGQGIAARLLEEALRWAGAHRAEISGEGKEGRSPELVEGDRLTGRGGRGGEGEEQGGVEDEWKGLVLSHAQSEVKEWWTKMGFVEDEGLGRWWEEGIEHVGMWRRLRDDEGVGFVEGGNEAYRRWKEER
ncbi:MAG: hypothetical protein Q9208_007338 [Pyrenodesmia sp. 3 TL-2023]